MTRAAAVLLAGAVVLGACSGGDDGGEEVGASRSTTTTVLEFTGDPGSAFCGLLHDYASDDGATPPPTTPEETDASYRVVLDQLQAVADAAPDELADDTARVAAGMAAYVDALRAVGFDRDALVDSPEGLEVSAAINDPAFATASARIGAYKEQVCGLEVTTTQP